MRRFVAGLTMFVVLGLVGNVALAHEHDHHHHWYGSYYGYYQPQVVVAPVPAVVVPYPTYPVYTAPAMVPAYTPYYGGYYPGSYPSLYYRGPRFSVGIGF